ncbi:MAG TPA: hypothetical protein ENH31_02950 [Nitrospirae bacterium]|nr:hypothetical protein BMS3Abin10_01935 [bacterium BMS3Abin10]GBE38210.1 hypothetical protein BMS3Bbin08_00813 [bacterium BMS3Bbin08]HDH49797.1 hypothetical protein [Nitrospirota bacterium]HDK16506.1 hypothetical protein [Nitrospirota bacterium]HDK81511.1 hypothetical protein [Nitrospirota bacterium]
MNKERTDEILGITRCARCGHRLEGEIECPFCAVFSDPPKKRELSRWVYITTCFLSSPLSLYSIIRSNRLNISEKILAFTGCVMWLGLYFLWFSR